MKTEMKWALFLVVLAGLGALIGSLAFWPTAALTGVLLLTARIAFFIIGWGMIALAIVLAYAALFGGD